MLKLNYCSKSGRASQDRSLLLPLCRDLNGPPENVGERARLIEAHYTEPTQPHKRHSGRKPQRRDCAYCPEKVSCYLELVPVMLAFEDGGEVPWELPYRRQIPPQGS